MFLSISLMGRGEPKLDYDVSFSSIRSTQHLVVTI